MPRKRSKSGTLPVLPTEWYGTFPHMSATTGGAADMAVPETQERAFSPRSHELGDERRRVAWDSGFLQRDSSSSPAAGASTGGGLPSLSSPTSSRHNPWADMYADVGVVGLRDGTGRFAFLVSYDLVDFVRRWPGPNATSTRCRASSADALSAESRRRGRGVTPQQQQRHQREQQGRWEHEQAALFEKGQALISGAADGKRPRKRVTAEGLEIFTVEHLLHRNSIDGGAMSVAVVDKALRGLQMASTVRQTERAKDRVSPRACAERIANLDHKPKLPGLTFPLLQVRLLYRRRHLGPRFARWRKKVRFEAHLEASAAAIAIQCAWRGKMPRRSGDAIAKQQTASARRRVAQWGQQWLRGARGRVRASRRAKVRGIRVRVYTCSFCSSSAPAHQYVHRWGTNSQK